MSGTAVISKSLPIFKPPTKLIFGSLLFTKIKVSEGEKIKTGKVLGIQGTTGRSTGEHLHYEVRYKNVPLNPKKFLEAGDTLINNENEIKYVDI